MTDGDTGPHVRAVDDPAASDRADILACYQYWSTQRGDRFAPAWADIELMALPALIIPFLTVVDVRRDAVNVPTYRYRFWGTGHVNYQGADYTHMTPRDVAPKAIGDMITQEYDDVLARRVPLLFHERLSAQVPEALSLRMPLSNDGRNVDGFLSYAGRHDYLEDVRQFFVTAST